MKKMPFILATLSIFSLLTACNKVSEKGDKGDKGETGEPGINGKDGIDGKDGSKIYTGEGTPNESIGVSGDLYIDTLSGDIYLKANTWGKTGNIKGATGETGATGTSIVRVYIDNSTGNLMCEMSDGSTINAGQIENITQHTVRFYINNSLYTEVRVKHGNKVTAPDVTVNEGYEINEWYTIEYNHKVPWSFTGCTVTEDTNLYLDNTPIEYQISYYLYGGYNDFDNPETYTIVSDDITLKDAHKDNYYFVGWYSDKDFTTPCSTIIKGSTGNKAFYAKFMSDENAISLGIKPKIDTINKTVTYGLYPQTCISDGNLISALNNLTSTESNGYYLLNGSYYAKKTAKPYENGTVDVTFDDNTTIINGETYWFKCEPITWKIIRSNNETYSLLSSKVLDGRFYDGGGAVTYDNSNIRKWLNSTFLSQAFGLHQSLIQTVEVDNSVTTTESSENTYFCGNTNDKIYLLSYQDYLKIDYGFDTTNGESTTRQCKSTDYARANYNSTSMEVDTMFCGSYWTRSHSTAAGGVSYVAYNGKLGKLSSGANGVGVRPGITIKIA